MSDFDPADFVDDDFQARKTQSAAASAPGQSGRAPTREEVDSRVTDTQQKLMELKRAQEELERERATLEETRRRQLEFQTKYQREGTISPAADHSLITAKRLEDLEARIAHWG